MGFLVAYYGVRGQGASIQVAAAVCVGFGAPFCFLHPVSHCSKFVKLSENWALDLF